MPLVTKRITRGGSFGPTEAVGDFDRVKRTGVIPCGSGDDHTLNLRDRRLVRNHDPSTGDLVLPPGRLDTRLPTPIV
jgi:hypothetical protein